MQNLITVLLVALAFGYTAWALSPKAWQLALRRRLGLRVPAATGGCGGCGGGCHSPVRGAATPLAAGTAVVTLHRRPPAR